MGSFGRRWTLAECERALRESAALAAPRPLSPGRYEEIRATGHDWPSMRTVRNRLGDGSWHAALRAIGYRRPALADGDRARTPRHTDDEIDTALRAASALAGGTLTRQRYEQMRATHPEWPSAKVIRVRYGSWASALSRVGQPAPDPARAGAHTTDAEMAAAIIATILAEPPLLTRQEYVARRRPGDPSPETITARYGSFRDGLRATLEGGGTHRADRTDTTRMPARRWTAAERRRLTELRAGRVPVEQIARELGRSAFGVQTQIKLMGLSAATSAVPHDVWMLADDERLVRMLYDGMRQEEIAQALNRTRNAVRNRLVVLRRSGVPIPLRTPGASQGWVDGPPGEPPMQALREFHGRTR